MDIRDILTFNRWRYSLFLAEDANFKQKARARSNTSKDPPLGPGWGTFVENEAYLRHISTAPNKTEVQFQSDAVLYQTVNSPDICRYPTVSASQRCGMLIRRSQKVCEQQASVRSSVLVMQCTGRTGWVIFKKANGKYIF